MGFFYGGFNFVDWLLRNKLVRVLGSFNIRDINLEWRIYYLGDLGYGFVISRVWE